MVRAAMIISLPAKAIGFGVRFDAEMNARGIEMIAPTIVPRNAIHTVSSIRYGTPDFVKSNKKSLIRHFRC